MGTSDPFPDVDVVIASLNCSQNLNRCLKRIKCQDYPGKLTIIVVDGGSQDDTIEIAKRFSDIVVVRKGSHPTGLDGQFQCAIDQGNSPIIWIINSDNYVVEDTAATDLVRPLIDDGTINIAIPKISLDDTFKSSFNDWLMMLENYMIETMEMKGVDGNSYAVINDVDYGLPNAVMIRRTAFESVGGFDVDVAVLQRLRIVNLSKGAIVRTAHIQHNSTKSASEYRTKLARRLNFHASMNEIERSKYFAPIDSHTSPYGNLSMTFLSYPLISFMQCWKQRNPKWLIGLLYPVIFIAVVLPNIRSAINLFRKHIGKVPDSDC